MLDIDENNYLEEIQVWQQESASKKKKHENSKYLSEIKVAKKTSFLEQFYGDSASKKSNSSQKQANSSIQRLQKSLFDTKHSTTKHFVYSIFKTPNRPVLGTSKKHFSEVNSIKNEQQQQQEEMKSLQLSQMLFQEHGILNISNQNIPQTTSVQQPFINEQQSNSKSKRKPSPELILANNSKFENIEVQQVLSARNNRNNVKMSVFSDLQLSTAGYKQKLKSFEKFSKQIRIVNVFNQNGKKKMKKVTNENLSLHNSVKKKLDLSITNFSSQHLKLSGFKASSLLKETVINKNQLDEQQKKICQIFQTIVESNRKLQSIKETLSLRKDFNLKQLFKYFDQKNKTYLTSNDISDAFISFDIVHTKKEAKLIISSFEKKTKNPTGKLLFQICLFYYINQLSFSDFYYMFLPTEQELAHLTESKMLAFHGASSHLKFISFTPTTRKSIKEFFKHIIETETEVQKLRLLLLQTNLNIHQVFCSFDKQKEGRITATTMRGILEESGMVVEKGDVENLFLRVTHRINADALNFQEFYGELNFKNYEK